jgi:hypothetical protein
MHFLALVASTLRGTLRAQRVALVAAASCYLAACATAPETRLDAPESPQTYLEEQLISQHRGSLNKRTLEGALLYYADFNAGSPNALRVPYDLLKMHCENRSGRWSVDAAPQTAAASLAQGDAPNDIRDVLADSDRRAVFGRYHCEASTSASWTADIQPTALTTTDETHIWRLQLLVKAELGETQTAGGELPPLQPFAAPPPAPGDSQPVAAAPGAELIQVPPGAARVPEAQSSPLDPQPPRPSPSSDKLLADPRPFGVNMGSDSPEVLASKLHLGTGKAGCSSGDKTDSCWDHPGGSEASSLRAHFADLGLGPVLAELEVRYRPADFVWLERSFRNAWGPPDAAGDRDSSHSWSWMHTTIALTHVGGEGSGETLVRISHRPTLVRAQLPAGNPGREQLGPLRIATPWQLQLGYEPAEMAQAKLRTAGFTFGTADCTDAGPHARPMLARTCRLHGGRMDGLQTAAVRVVDIGDGRARLAQLEYTFGKQVLDATVDELRKQYGEPIPVIGGALEWWTGPVGIEIMPAAETFALRYFHGRLIEYFFNVAEKNQASEKAIQRQGL